jgi:type I restriction enzyme S subunit
MSNGIPDNWEAMPLSELLETLESGSRPRGGVRGIALGIPSFGGEHLTDDGTVDFSSIKYVPPEFAKKMTKGRIKTNDILVVKDGATTGKTSFVGSDFPFSDAVVNEHVFICRPSKMVDPKYLYYFLASHEGQNRILENFKGSAQGGINQSFAPNTEVPVAPFDLQKKIVRKLDKILINVDTDTARLKKIPGILKKFRQSVLSAACTGKLTTDWRENKQGGLNSNSADMSNAESVEKIIDVPESWKWTSLHSICDPQRFICYGVIKLGHEFPSGINCLRTSDVKPLNIDISDVKKIDPRISSQYERTLLKGGEILVNVRGTLGGVAVVPSELRGWNVSREVAVIPVDNVVPEFIAFWIASIPCQNWLTGVARGVAYTGINIKDLKRLPVALPSNEEQIEIVRRTKEFFNLADHIENR